MNSKQTLQQCIQDCRQSVSQLQTIAKQAQNQQLRSTLNESSHRLEMCISECDYAVKDLP